MEHSECKREQYETQHLLLSVFEAEKPAVVLICILIWRFSCKVMEIFNITAQTDVYKLLRQKINYLQDRLSSYWKLG